MQRRLERARDDLRLAGVVDAGPPRVRLRREDARKLIEKLPHVRREDRRQLLERALDVVSEGRAGQRFEERAAEIERAQLRQRQSCRQPFERLAVDAPARPPIVVRSIVVDGEARFLEGLEVAADGAGGDATERGEIVDCDAGRARPLDLAQDGPLADDLGVAGHGEILAIAGWQDCRIAERKGERGKG